MKRQHWKKFLLSGRLSEVELNLIITHWNQQSVFKKGKFNGETFKIVLRWLGKNSLNFRKQKIKRQRRRKWNVIYIVADCDSCTNDDATTCSCGRSVKKFCWFRELKRVKSERNSHKEIYFIGIQYREREYLFLSHF